MQVTIWGEGGFDPSKPNNNMIDQYEIADPEPTAQEIAKASALAKLAALGLTEEEVIALLNN
jgi:hypothetical protein